MCHRLHHWSREAHPDQIPPPLKSNSVRIVAVQSPRHTLSGPKMRSFWKKCMCWTVSIILILLVLMGAIIGILYLIFRPKLPRYSLERFRVDDFRVFDNMSVYARFDLTINATNPNKRIGIYYKQGSNLTVFYNDTSLCSGSLPSFYHGHRNSTLFHVFLTGQAQFGSRVITELLEQERTGMIPLFLRGRVPVRIKFGTLKLRTVRYLVRCRLVVDRLVADNLTRIRSSSCNLKLRL